MRQEAVDRELSGEDKTRNEGDGHPETGHADPVDVKTAIDVAVEAEGAFIEGGPAEAELQSTVVILVVSGVGGGKAA